MAKVEYDTHKIPSIVLNPYEKEELEETGYVQVDEHLFVILTAEEPQRVVAAKQIPYNCIKFTERKDGYEFLFDNGGIGNGK